MNERSKADPPVRCEGCGSELPEPLTHCEWCGAEYPVPDEEAPAAQSGVANSTSVPKGSET